VPQRAQGIQSVAPGAQQAGEERLHQAMPFTATSFSGD
jgi:hypothetical protein